MHHLDQERLNLYLDDRLDPAARRLVEQHLVSCPRCAAELAELRALFADIAALPTEPVPTDIAALVLAQLAAAPQPARRPLPRPLVGVLMVLQLALALLLMLWLAPTIRTQMAQLLDRLGASDMVGLVPMLLSWAASQFLWLAESAALLGRLPPLLAATPGQWTVALLVGAALWLLGNRLLVAGIANRTEPVEENA